MSGGVGPALVRGRENREAAAADVPACQRGPGLCRTTVSWLINDDRARRADSPAMNAGLATPDGDN